ncbi:MULTISPECIES: hypothetical protein [Prauserella salsuginis group]|uniref:Uncharacterized protein n=1 Tax=Prauserella salsuginis TaxID=387889 RepID=A0ABW6G7K6_9PSEU|nr:MULTISPECIES: hypothetical protein [Prauserella salsuginis group]MCR3719551.1 hypothetical protein [Prauserella flava]MCR3735435.1 hypothetical protein [Prauserella salsuginis]
MRRHDTTEGAWANQQIPVSAADIPAPDDAGVPGNAAVPGDVAPDDAAWSVGPVTDSVTGAAAAPEFALEANPADVAEQQLTVPTEPPDRG